MNAVPFGPFRIFRAETAMPLSEDASEMDLLAALDPHAVAVQELLRPHGPKPLGRDLEPFTRGWFEELEIKRYTPHGDWLRRSLEFGRHKHEQLLMFGPGAGTDAIQYQRHETHVTIATTPDDCPALIQRNFELRGLAIRTCRILADGTLPIETGRFDLAYLNLLYTPPADLSQRVSEIYRVLKPGGKIFVLAPARYDAGFWQRIFTPWRTWALGDGHLSMAPRYSHRALSKEFPQFVDTHISRRHLRRSELPYLWRSTPINLMQRILGRVVVLKAFKSILAHTETLRQAA